MNKFALSLIALMVATPSFAKVTTLNCEMEKYPKQIITFKMKDLGSASMTFLNADPDDDYSAVFTTTSEDETVIRIVDTLNGQGGDLRIGDDRISFFGDSAGIDFVYLDLFKNSGFKKGFVRTDMNFGEEKDYTKISCNLK